MTYTLPEIRIPNAEYDDRQAITARQGRRLAHLLSSTYGRSRFYTEKFDRAGICVESLRLPEDLALLPMTAKAELVANQEKEPPWGTVLTESVDRYTRYNQTSSTTGLPLRWPDTNETWQWMLECWKAVYRAARVGPEDRILFAFSFGPFLGFWTAFDAACQLGALAVPTGAMSSEQRLALITAVRPTVVCCTPTYALRLAEVATARTGRVTPLSESSVRTVIVAGEPGGNIPMTRRRIEEMWGARVIDQYGLTEVGPVSFECWEGPGYLHVNENEFISEVIDPVTLQQVPDGEPGELVLTNLGRTSSPVIRYRTGDMVVRRSERCVCGRTFARLDGGIIARTDDMITIRGVNVYPTAIESIVRRFIEIVEFQTVVSQPGAQRSCSLRIELEPTADRLVTVRSVAQHLRDALGLTVSVEVAEPGTLPRFEMKANRFVIER